MPILAASCSVVFTADEGVRGGKVIPLKATVDTALEGCDCVRRVFVAERTGGKVNMMVDRDVWLEKVWYSVTAEFHIQNLEFRAFDIIMITPWD